MKLATFEFRGEEKWGFVMENPADGQLWVFEPAAVDSQLQESATTTNGYSVSMPEFMENSVWPDTLVDFLKLEDAGMDTLRRMEGFLKVFLEQSDEARMRFCGHPLSDVRLCAPIPRPRLMWGLVQNCPTFIRSNPARTSSNLYPQGHQRPMGSVVGDGQLFVHPKDAGPLAFNVELGVVIGKKGRYIPVNRAMEYVAGFTVVTDSSTAGYMKAMDTGSPDVYSAQASTDWYVGATMSWGGKMTDAHCAMGPFLTTKDEIGNVYDLLVYTKMGGHLRDRAHTSALLLGVERVIQWYSSFATLYPGDVLHLGTMGTDGLKLPEKFAYSGPECTIDSEIERVGYLKTPVLNLNCPDWRSGDDETVTMHESPAVRYYMKKGLGEIGEAREWKVENVPQFYTVFKNYKAIGPKEGMKVLKTPRFLCAPNTALGRSGQEAELPPRCGSLEISVELAMVIKKLAKGVKAESAESYILGFLPMVSLTDSSFDDILVEPTTLQEKGLPLVYGRWADGFNAVADTPVPMRVKDAFRKVMTLSAGGQTVKNDTSEYICDAASALEFISKYITLFPGDVITLGHTENRIRLSREEIADRTEIRGEIEDIGKVSFTLRRSAAPDNSKPVNQLRL